MASRSLDEISWWHRVRLPFPWRRAPVGDTLPVGDMLTRFESLGDNCEFGLVQRYGGVEPLGLFRFSNVQAASLVAALDSDFSHYGAGDDLFLTGGDGLPLVCRSRAHGFPYTVSDAPPGMSREAVLAREIRKVAYLKRRLLEDLAAGEKILVRKNVQGDTREAIAALDAAIARHGGCTLLEVHAVGEGEKPGTVRRLGPNRLEGFVRRFAPGEAAYAIDLEPWYALCWNALRIVSDRPALRPAARPDSILPRRLGRLQTHRLGQGAGSVDTREQGIEVFGAAQDVGRLPPRAVCVFSAWVWLPDDFAGSHVGAALSLTRLGWRDADFGLRDSWQRVFFGALVPDACPPLTIGLVAAGPEGARFFSAGWRLEQGPVPSEAPPPGYRPR